MNKEKRTKYCFKLPWWDFLYIIPVFSIVFWFLWLAISAKSIIGVIFILLVIYFGLTLNFRWVLCFKNSEISVFHIFQGIRRIPYDKIIKIKRRIFLIVVYYKQDKKVKRAKFETGNNKYRDTVAEFLKEKGIKEVG